MVRPSHRREMAKKTIQEGRLNIRQACEAFCISRTCYRYKAKLSEENMRIADWLVRLTTEQRNWGFGLCFLYLRNMKQHCPVRFLHEQFPGFVDSACQADRVAFVIH